MENDNWKSRIQKDREAFDSRKPKDLWPSIEAELKTAKQPKYIELYKVYRIAAIVVVAIGVGFFLLFNTVNERSDLHASDHNSESDKKLYPIELIEIENFYASEIDEKLKKVQTLTDDDLALEEIQLLKDEFDLLKLEMGDQINDEKVIEAMIQNYRLRLELLQEILQDLAPNESRTQPTVYEKYI